MVGNDNEIDHLRLRQISKKILPQEQMNKFLRKIDKFEQQKIKKFQEERVESGLAELTELELVTLHPKRDKNTTIQDFEWKKVFMEYMRDEQRVFMSSRTEDFGTKGRRERDPFNGMKDKLNSNYDLPGRRENRGASAPPSSSTPKSKKNCVIHPTSSHSSWEC